MSIEHKSESQKETKFAPCRLGRRSDHLVFPAARPARRSTLRLPQPRGSCAATSMAHRGKRSEFALQKRKAFRFIQDTAFIDYICGETVDLVERGEVEDHLALFFADPDRRVIPEVFPGLVLLDGYGTGAFQPKNVLTNLVKSPLCSPPNICFQSTVRR